MRRQSSRSLPLQKATRTLLPLKSKLDFIPCLPSAPLKGHILPYKYLITDSGIVKQNHKKQQALKRSGKAPLPLHPQARLCSGLRSSPRVMAASGTRSLPWGKEPSSVALLCCSFLLTLPPLLCGSSVGCSPSGNICSAMEHPLLLWPWCLHCCFSLFFHVPSACQVFFALS